MADQANFERDAMQFAPQLYSAAMRMTRNPSDAEDLVQETFIKAFRAIDGWRGEASFRSWLFRIGANLRKDWYRKERGRVVMPIMENDLRDAADPASARDTRTRASLLAATPPAGPTAPSRRTLPRRAPASGGPRPRIPKTCRPTNLLESSLQAAPKVRQPVWPTP